MAAPVLAPATTQDEPDWGELRWYAGQGTTVLGESGIVTFGIIGGPDWAPAIARIAKPDEPEDDTSNVALDAPEPPELLIVT